MTAPAPIAEPSSSKNGRASVQRLREGAVAQLDHVAEQNDLVRALDLGPERLAELRAAQQVDVPARAEVKVGDDDRAHPPILPRPAEGALARRTPLSSRCEVGARDRGCHETGIPVENPATGETIATVPDLGAGEVEAMVALAREAQPIWAAIGFEGRAEVLLAAREWMVANGERIVRRSAPRPVAPPTKPSSPSSPTGSRARVLGKEAPVYLADEEIESASPFVRGRRLSVRYAPLGVVGVIGPWNFPLNNSFGDCIPALAAGNAVVLKPSEVTPLTSLLMAEMLAECGIPDGVFQVATGRGETGAALIDGVDYGHVHRLGRDRQEGDGAGGRDADAGRLELGGKDPMIVLADADIERAANAAVAYGLNNSGQVCISVERIYVEEPVHDEFVGG